MIDKPKRKVDHNILDLVRKRNCEVCGKRATHAEPSQACHIRSRGAGGNDSWDNLLGMCWKCHHDQHLYGWRKMMELYPFLKQVLANKGWRIGNYGKLVRYD